MRRTYRAHRPSVTVYRDWGAPRRFLLQSEHTQAPRHAPLGYEVAIRGDEIFIAGNNVCQARASTARGSSDSWEEFDKLQPLDSHMGGGVTTVIEKEPSLHHAAQLERGAEAYVINVFRNSAGAPLRARGHAGVE